MCENLAFDWGNPEVEWSAIPNEEMLWALTRMRLSSAPMFSNQPTSNVLQEEIIKNRLYQKRKNWSHQERRRRRIDRPPAQRGVDASKSSSDEDLGEDELGRIIQQKHYSVKRGHAWYECWSIGPIQTDSMIPTPIKPTEPSAPVRFQKFVGGSFVSGRPWSERV